MALPAEELQIPPLLDRYEVREIIGAGGMGHVFKGWDLRLEAHVAIKIARPELSSDATMRERLVREARAAASIHHERVVGIRDIGEAEEGTPFVVMDFLDGVPLSTLLSERGRIPWREAAGVLEQIAEGLEAAHDAGIVHRDLKPSNVFISESEDRVRCTLIDFGLARVVDLDDEARTLTRDGQILGTPRYMSPEQITGEHPIGPASDIYSFGCIAHQILGGSAPFQGTLHQLLHKHINHAPPKLVDVPAVVARLVDRCLAKQPGKRFQSVRAIRLQLGLAAASQNTEADRRGVHGGWLGAAAGIGLMAGWAVWGTSDAAERAAEVVTAESAVPVGSSPSGEALVDVAPPSEGAASPASVAAVEQPGPPDSDPPGELTSAGFAPDVGSVPADAQPAESAKAQRPRPTKASPRRRPSTTGAEERPDPEVSEPAPPSANPDSTRARTREEILAELDGL